ncbi:hypothetical protein [Roseibium aquae]|uniref:hypothetical protein n=1 Tax=Roseibium aquae TaxID=1323746 RepID=UPI00123D79D3|nr:hypothetical protein [Roseibium aquae]
MKTIDVKEVARMLRVVADRLEGGNIESQEAYNELMWNLHAVHKSAGTMIRQLDEMYEAARVVN